MSGKQTTIKHKLFAIPHYTQSITQYHEQLQSLEPQQHRQIKHSRYGKEFKKINECQKHDYESRKIDCLKEALHSFCQPEFKGFIECLDKSKNKKQCDGKVGQYFMCVERNMKNVFWSGIMYF